MKGLQSSYPPAIAGQLTEDGRLRPEALEVLGHGVLQVAQISEDSIGQFRPQVLEDPLTGFSSGE